MRILRSISAFLVGYLVSLLSSVLWFNQVAHRDPSRPPSLRFLFVSAVFAAFFAVLSGYVASMIAGEPAQAVARSIAAFIVLVAIWSWFETPGKSHWMQVVAMLLMAPAVLFGRFLHARASTLHAGRVARPSNF